LHAHSSSSRFTPRVGGGSAFYVRPQRAHLPNNQTQHYETRSRLNLEASLQPRLCGSYHSVAFPRSSRLAHGLFRGHSSSRAFVYARA
jgi:hypothetical protein